MGRIAGKYELIRELGRGGMGSVYEALGPEGHRVALKVMSPDGAEDQHTKLVRFQREALAAAGLDTPHVVKVFDAGIDETDGCRYLAMELLEGEDVAQLLKRIGPLPPPLAAAIVTQACRGLLAAHARGVVHRDIKPSNLFLARMPSGEHLVKVLDFGIAKVSPTEAVAAGVDAGTVTETGAVIGSPQYMSPEQAMGLKTIDSRTDVWSLGIVLHRCLSGRTPFDEHSTLGRVILAICSSEPVPVQDHAPWVSADLAKVVRQALRREAVARFGSVQALAEALRQHLDWGVTITAEMVRPMTTAERTVVAVRHPSHVASATGADADVTLRVPDSAGTLLMNASVESEDSRTATQWAESPLAPPPKRPWHQSVLATAGGFVLLAGLGVGAYELRPKESPLRRTEGTSTPTVAAEPPAATTPVETAKADSAPPATAWVKVGPPGVEVDVDGRPTPIQSGSVPIEGSVGNVHKVRLHTGNRAIEVDVIATDQGPRPNEIVLPKATAVAHVAAAAAKPREHTTKPTSGGPIKKPTTPTGIDREFQ